MNFFDVQWWLIGLTIITAAVYQVLIKYWSYFSRNGVKFVRGLPLLGSHYKVVFFKQDIQTSHHELYKAFPNERFVGYYEIGGKPKYLIRDPELIKQLAIKDFDHFVDHSISIDHNIEPMIGRSLFMMRGQRWRDMRATVSPAFTSSKMRLMCSLVNECAEKFCEELKKEVGADNRAKVYDLTKLFSCFANDAIATSAFGVQLNSMVDKDNEFYKFSEVLSKSNIIQGIKFLGFLSVPWLMKWLKIRLLTHKESNYFRNLVNGNMEYREKNKIIRHDMINLLMEARRGNLLHTSDPKSDKEIEIGFATVQESDVGKSSQKITEWHDDDFVAQSIIFFLAGFTGLTQTPAFLVHKLIIKPNIQQRLFEEIQETHRKLNGAPITYDALRDMKYLDQVVSEVLRIWSPAPFIDRRVNKPYVLETMDGNMVQLNVGDCVLFPIHSIQTDAKYYSKPEDFDPERFSDENKGNIQPGTYFPFGVGPRNCIGSRFGLIGIKSIIYHLFLNFSLEKCEKTHDPIKIQVGPRANLMPEKGFWANIKAR